MTSTTGICKAKKKSGAACHARVIPGSHFCLFHDPLKAAERAKGRQMGGKARQGRQIGAALRVEPVTLRTAEDILRVVEESLNDVRQMENSIAKARTIATLATVAVRVIEVTELEQRIAALEQLNKEQESHEYAR